MFYLLKTSLLHNKGRTINHFKSVDSFFKNSSILGSDLHRLVSRGPSKDFPVQVG